MLNKGLTMSIIFEAESLNYGEGLGNISVLKKMSRGDGRTYTYISRQALRYSMIGQLGWNNTPVSGKNGVVQFVPEATVADYPEIDLFGYMKTEAEKGAATRPAVVRLSNAISLEPYSSDTDFLTNMGLARRADSDNSIAQREIHHSYYAYTVTVDLDRIGVDEGTKEELPMDKRAERVCAFLETVRNLYRDIAGRRENLAPLFVIGGVYDRKNPYFEGLLSVRNNRLMTDAILEVINDDEAVKKNTVCGMRSVFANTDEAKRILTESGADTGSVGEFFNKIEDRVKAVYAE